MKSHTLSCFAAGLGLVAVTSCAPSVRDTVSVATNDLGITALSIDRTTEPQRSLLTIDAFDASGAEVAHLELRAGNVTYSYDWGTAPELDTEGKDIRIVLRGSEYHDVIPGLGFHRVPEPMTARSPFAVFVRIAEVAEVLSAEGGIAYEARVLVARPASDGEVSYGAQGCPSSLFPSSLNTCCYDNAYYQAYGGNFGSFFTSRWHLAGQPVCRDLNGNTGCGQGASACYYGPCAMHSESLGAASGYPKIFFYGGGGLQCDGDNGLGWYWPAAWSGEGTYGGVSAGCPYTSCTTDGQPH